MLPQKGRPHILKVNLCRLLPFEHPLLVSSRDFQQTQVREAQRLCMPDPGKWSTLLRYGGSRDKRPREPMCGNLSPPPCHMLHADSHCYFSPVRMSRFSLRRLTRMTGEPAGVRLGCLAQQAAADAVAESPEPEAGRWGGGEPHTGETWEGIFGPFRERNVFYVSFFFLRLGPTKAFGFLRIGPSKSGLAFCRGVVAAPRTPS